MVKQHPETLPMNICNGCFCDSYYRWAEKWTISSSRPILTRAIACFSSKFGKFCLEAMLKTRISVISPLNRREQWRGAQTQHNRTILASFNLFDLANTSINWLFRSIGLLNDQWWTEWSNAVSCNQSKQMKQTKTNQTLLRRLESNNSDWCPREKLKLVQLMLDRSILPYSSLKLTDFCSDLFAGLR